MKNQALWLLLLFVDLNVEMGFFFPEPLLKVKPTFISRTMSAVMTAHTPFLFKGRRKPGAKQSNPATRAARPALSGNTTGLLNFSSSLTFVMGHMNAFHKSDAAASSVCCKSRFLRSERARA